MTSLFIPVTQVAEAAYNDLRRYYNEHDYNATYLRAFETFLSPLLKENFLANHPRYREVTEAYPLPDEDDDEHQYLPAKGFRLYLMMYEGIMRECHIVGGWEDAQQNDVPEADLVVDPLGDYKRRS